MYLKKVNDDYKRKEQEIQEKLFECIDNKCSVVFNSGAGSGKTYALVECLKYIVNNYGKKLEDHNQGVICITYTNVATNHIKQKIGNSRIIHVSTIHERIWDLIRHYQAQLVNIHKEKVQSEIKNINNDISTNPKYSWYQDLSEKDKEDFKQIMYVHKTVFNESYSLNSPDFKKSMPTELTVYGDIMKNVTYFKSLVSNIYKIKRLEECLCKINDGLNNSVEYNAMYNRDRLDKMRISHDTVLEYGLKMVEQHPILRQMIIDKYPYILIDEYQDTSENVVRFMNLLDEYSRKIHHDIFVGYFGDMIQNIYSDGVGKNLKQIHSNLYDVKKEFNRRSFQEVVDVANKIRNDDIEQISIYDDCKGGKIEFYYGNQSDVDKFINHCKEEWSIDNVKPLHCFFTTNQLVVEYSDFINFYNSIKNTSKYRGANYEQLNTELLSDDVKKLGAIPKLLYNLMNLYNGLKNEHAPLRQILISEEIYNINKNDLLELIFALKKIDGTTLDDIIKSMFDISNDCSNSKLNLLINLIFNMDNASYLQVKNYIQESLFKDESEQTKVEKGMEDLLNVKVDELENWFRYISLENKSDKEVIYHTYHGTKGLEFDNVLIIMGKGFGKEKTYFEDFFKKYDMQLSDDYLYEKARNLLYVAVTRAIKNLRVLYIDDIEPIRKGVQNVFGTIEKVEKLIGKGVC